MMFQPVHTLEHLIAPGQGRFKRHRMLRQQPALFVDTGLKGTMPRRQFE